MKALITAEDIVKAAESGLKKIPIQSTTIVTPAALDAAKEMNVILEINSENRKPNEVQKQEINEGNNNITADLIAKIVSEILRTLPARENLAASMLKKVDATGVKIVKGSTVICEKYDTGNPNDNIGIKEIFTIRDTPNMVAGFITVEKSTITWEPVYEEIYFVVDGYFDLIVNDHSYNVERGDVFYIPGKTSVKLSVPDKIKLFFLTYPNRWAGN